MVPDAWLGGGLLKVPWVHESAEAVLSRTGHVFSCSSLAKVAHGLGLLGPALVTTAFVTKTRPGQSIISVGLIFTAHCCAVVSSAQRSGNASES